MPSVTLTPQLSGSPSRRLYFLGAVHKYEAPTTITSPEAGKGGVARAGANRELWAPGKALAASLVSQSPDTWAPTGTGCNAAPHKQSPLSPSKRSSQTFRRFASDSMPELVPAAKVVRSETQVGHRLCHRLHSDRPSRCSGREGTTFPTAVRRSNPGRWQSRPLWGWGSRPLAESSPRTVAEPSPSQPQGVGPAGLGSWEGGAVPTPRAAASRRWPTPSQ